MRKLISIALVLVMVFAVAAISVSALASPSGQSFYNISTSAEGKGSGAADKNKIDKEASGSDAYVTLTASASGGYFTKWIMSGSYNKISGDEYSPVFVIQPLSDVTAVASFQADKDYFTISKGTITGDGTISISPEKVKLGETVTLTATDGNDKFAAWDLACEYEIVSGDLKSKSLVIKPHTDVTVNATFTSDGKAPEKKDSDDTTSTTTSPKTGDPTFMVVALVLMAMFAGAFAVKKIKD